MLLMLSFILVGPKKLYSIHGYDGFEIFAKDMDLAVNSPSWKLVKPSWKK